MSQKPNNDPRRTASYGTQTRIVTRTDTRPRTTSATAGGTTVGSAKASAARRAEPRKRARPKRDMRRTAKRAGAKLLMFSVMFVLLFLVCIGGLTLSLRGSAVANPKLTYQIGANDSVVSVRSIRRNTLYRDGLLYINMSELASYCEFTTTGTVREIRFISKTETNDNVRFILGTPIAYVNGYQVRLNGAVIYEDDAVLVPSDFITHYVSGLDVSVDEKTGKVILSRTVDADYEAPVSIRDNAGDVHYEQIVFTLQQQQPCERISESSVLYQNPSVQTAQTGTDDPASP